MSGGVIVPAGVAAQGVGDQVPAGWQNSRDYVLYHRKTVALTTSAQSVVFYDTTVDGADGNVGRANSVPSYFLAKAIQFDCYYKGAAAMTEAQSQDWMAAVRGSRVVLWRDQQERVFDAPLVALIRELDAPAKIGTAASGYGLRVVITPRVINGSVVFAPQAFIKGEVFVPAVPTGGVSVEMTFATHGLLLLTPGA